MQEIRPDGELLDGLQRDTCHQSVKAGGEQIVQSFCQAFLCELSQAESTVTHDRRHVIGSEAVGHAPQIVMTKTYATENNRHAIAGGDFTARVFADRVVNDVEDSRPAKNIHDHRQVAQALGNINLNIHDVEFQVVSLYYTKPGSEPYQIVVHNRPSM